MINAKRVRGAAVGLLAAVMSMSSLIVPTYAETSTSNSYGQTSVYAYKPSSFEIKVPKEIQMNGDDVTYVVNVVADLVNENDYVIVKPSSDTMTLTKCSSSQRVSSIEATVSSNVSLVSNGTYDTLADGTKSYVWMDTGVNTRGHIQIKSDNSKASGKYNGTLNFTATLYSPNSPGLKNADDSVVKTWDSLIRNNRYFVTDSLTGGVYSANSDSINATRLVLPDTGEIKAIGSKIGSITYRGFRESNVSLTSIKIPKSVTNIVADSFTALTNLTTIDFMGTEDEWNSITGLSEAGIPEGVTINYNVK